MGNSSEHRTRVTAGTVTMLRRVAERSTSRQKERCPIPNLMHTEGWPPMSDMRSIDQESRRLVREELLTNILLEAGAGSGKTQMLADRMAAGVAAGVYSVEHMAAVTFT